MGLLENIRQDILDISSNVDDGFGVELIFTAPTAETATINGLHTKHHFALDGESGKPVNSKNAHISFSEKLLTDLGYPVRINGEVFMRGHKVAAKDSTGNTCIYKITESFPDETVGFIVCLLGQFE